MTQHRIHRTGADWIAPAPQLTPWQRERRDGPIGKMERVVRASPESIWDVAALWTVVFIAMAGLGLLAAVLA